MSCLVWTYFCVQLSSSTRVVLLFSDHTRLGLTRHRHPTERRAGMDDDESAVYCLPECRTLFSNQSPPTCDETAPNTRTPVMCVMPRPCMWCGGLRRTAHMPPCHAVPPVGHGRQALHHSFRQLRKIRLCPDTVPTACGRKQHCGPSRCGAGSLSSHSAWPMATGRRKLPQRMET